MTEIRTASAAVQPCQLYSHTTSPVPSRTQGHHRHPIYLQERVYGRVKDPDLLWVCGLCHDNIHEALGWLLGESRRPDPMPGYKALAEAKRAYLWYLRASS